MVEFLVVGAVGMALLVVVPLLILKVAFGLLIGLIALPFKLLAAVFKLGGALLGGIAGLGVALFAGLVAIVGVAVCLPMLLLALPLIPLLVVAAGLWVLVKGGLAILA